MIGEDLQVALRDLVAAGDRAAAELMLVADGGPATWRAGLSAYVESGARAAAEVFDQAAAAGPAAACHRALGDVDRAHRLVSRAVGEGSWRVSAALQASHEGGRTTTAGNPLLMLVTTLNRAYHALDHDRQAAALAESLIAVRLSRGGYPGYEPFALSVGAAAKARLGWLAAALTDAAVAVRTGQLRGARTDAAFGLLVLGGVHRRRRDVPQARDALEAALRAPIGTQALRGRVLAELGRVRAADDLAAARELTHRSVAVSTGTARVDALLAHGWVALLSGDPQTAAFDAEEAGESTEALELLGLAAPDSVHLAEEAVVRYRSTGDRTGEARAWMIVSAMRHHPESSRTEQDVLRRNGIHLESRIADAFTALAARTPAVAVRAMGTFEVLRGGVVVPAGEWQSKKARDLLKILVAHRGRPVPRSRLVELLWPNEPATRGGHRLSVLLSIARRVLCPDRTGPITVDRFAIALDLASVDVDLERFLTTAADAVEAHRQGRHDAPALLAAAESLYTGEFLPDDGSVDWAQDLRDEVELAYVGVLRAIADATPDVDHRTNSLRRVLRRDPYDEQAHVELVRGLHQAGRHGEAHRRYQAYVRGMREIGVPPVPESLCGHRRLESVVR